MNLVAERRAPKFEPDAKNGKIKAGAGDVDIKNKKICKNKIIAKEKIELSKKFSNHIEFMDYIPTHEVITYRHLFAYGFYVM